MSKNKLLPTKAECRKIRRLIEGAKTKDAVIAEFAYRNTADGEGESFTGAYQYFSVAGQIVRVLQPVPSNSRITRTGKVIRSIDATKKMDFAYPPEQDL